MFYVGLVHRKAKRASDPEFFIRVRSESFSFHCVAFNEKRARVAVRRYVKGNLSAALVCLDDGDNEPGTARKKQYARNLRRQLMIPGNGPGGFEVDYRDRRK
jgi:hypothetical protein